MDGIMTRGRVVGSIFLVSCLLLTGVSGWLPHAAATDFERLLQDAASGSEPERLHALKILGRSGDPRALQPLRAAVQDDNATIRECARAALRALSDTLHGIYRAVAVWIDTFLITLGAYTSPPPPVETTQYQRYI